MAAADFLDLLPVCDEDAVGMLCVAHVPRAAAEKYVSDIPRNAQRPQVLRQIASKPFAFAADAQKHMSSPEKTSFEEARERAESPKWWHAHGGKRVVDLLPIDDDDDVVMSGHVPGVLSPTPLRIAFLEDRVNRLETEIVRLKAQEAFKRTAWEMPASILLAAADPDATPASIYSQLKRT